MSSTGQSSEDKKAEDEVLIRCWRTRMTSMEGWQFTVGGLGIGLAVSAFAPNHWRPLARRAPFYVFGTAGIFTDHYASERICEMQLAAWKKLPPAERAAADRARNDAIARATGSQPQQQQQQQKPALPPLASTPTVASGGSGSGSSGGGSGAGGGDAKPKS